MPNSNGPNGALGSGSMVAAASQPLTRGVPTPEWNYKDVFRWTNTETLDAVAAAAANRPTGYIWQYIWSSPIFDLRPDLVSEIGNTKQGVPIWSKSARLRVLVTGARGENINMENWIITGRQFVSLFSANVQRGNPAGSAGFSASPNMVQLNNFEATNLFYPTQNVNLIGQAGGAMAGFVTPSADLGGGEGYPVRYWRIVLVFNVLQEEQLPLPDPVAPDDVNILAAVY